MSSGPAPDYLETLCRYYEEEIEGEAYFLALAERFPRRDEQDKMRLLAAVETHAAAAVRPLVERHGLRPAAAAALHRTGRAQAEAETLDWAALVAEMRESFPGYVRDFEALEAAAPAADLPALRMLTAHEVAAVAFLELESAGAEDSAAPLRHYLETGTA